MRQDLRGAFERGTVALQHPLARLPIRILIRRAAAGVPLPDARQLTELAEHGAFVASVLLGQRGCQGAQAAATGGQVAGRAEVGEGPLPLMRLAFPPLRGLKLLQRSFSPDRRV